MVERDAPHQFGFTLETFGILRRRRKHAAQNIMERYLIVAKRFTQAYREALGEPVAVREARCLAAREGSVEEPAHT